MQSCFSLKSKPSLWTFRCVDTAVMEKAEVSCAKEGIGQNIAMMAAVARIRVICEDLPWVDGRDFVGVHSAVSVTPPSYPVCMGLYSGDSWMRRTLEERRP